MRLHRQLRLWDRFPRRLPLGLRLLRLRCPLRLRLRRWLGCQLRRRHLLPLQRAKKRQLPFRLRTLEFLVEALRMTLKRRVGDR